MKKYILTSLFSAFVALSALGQVSPGGNSVTLIIPPGGFSNLVSVINGYAKVTQAIVSAPTNGSAGGLFIDTPTNQTSYVVSAYTNTISYGTNQTQIYTNWIGTIQTNTYFALIDVTNNVVPQTTNAYSINFSLYAPAGTSSRIDQQTYNFLNGIWFTNTTAQSATVTVNYTQ